jgi:hypothetical protein
MILRCIWNIIYSSIKTAYIPLQAKKKIHLAIVFISILKTISVLINRVTKVFEGSMKNAPKDLH